MAAETIINTIRHGHTQFNAEKRYAGSIDIPLSEKGVIECQKAVPALAKYHFDIVITSTLKRSMETAYLLVNGNVPVINSKLCNERNFGVMEGHTWEEVRAFTPPVLMIEVGDDLHTVNPRGGEPFEDVWQRAKSFRNYLFRAYRGKNILVISHGVFLQMFHGVLRGSTCIESLATYPANLELAQFCFSGKKLVSERAEKLNANGPEVRF